MADPAEILEAHFLDAVRALAAGAPASAASPVSPVSPVSPDEPVRPRTQLTGRQCLALFDAQASSRHLDLEARRLTAGGEGFYSIGSAGHEGNAALAHALRPTDPALLHYRSGAFYVARAAQRPAVTDPVADVLLGVVAAAAEPISGGRHKVFGHHGLAVIPQTSTIASHLPRAVGLALGIERGRKLAVASPWPGDAIVVCSFGDASANHATALAGLNTAAYTAYQGLPLPLLFVCEDNRLGISVPTPPEWIQATWSSRPGLRYFDADGCDVAQTHDAAVAAVDFVRHRRAPAFLHLRMVRLLGHAGSDVESAYRRPVELAADLDRDPLVTTARLLVESGQSTPEEIIARYAAAGARVREVAGQVRTARRLASAVEVMEPLELPAAEAIAGRLPVAPTAPRRQPGELLTLAQSINRALADALAARPNMLVFGEDVARKGGVYGVTRGLRERFGAARVFDTLLDETSILGLASGAALAGLLPVPEIQYLAYLHNAEDQLRGEAASLRFFSQGQYANPMVVRIAGFGYQRGFGGHFHNDSAIAVLRDIPGVVIAAPSRPDDAAATLRTCLAAASLGVVCVVVEPIALYHERDLHEPGDGRWLAPYEASSTHVPLGRARTYGVGGDLTIVTFGNGLRMSLRAASNLAAASSIGCRVVDLRWLAPLPIDDVMREARATGRVLIADETRRSGGVSEAVIAALVDGGFTGPIARVTSEDSYVPLGPAAHSVLLSQAAIESRALDLFG